MKLISIVFPWNGFNSLWAVQWSVVGFLLLGFLVFFGGGGGSCSSNIEIGGLDIIRIFSIKFQVRCCWLEGYFRTLHLHIGHIFTSLATAGFILEELMSKMTRLLIIPAVGLILCVICNSTSEPAESQPGCCLFLFTGNLPVSDSGCYGVAFQSGDVWLPWTLLPVSFDSCVDAFALSTVNWSPVSQLLVLLLSSSWIHSVSLVSVTALLSSTHPH